jgi:dTDP-L-rhamnose 4-epimerase
MALSRLSSLIFPRSNQPRLPGTVVATYVANSCRRLREESQVSELRTSDKSSHNGTAIHLGGRSYDARLPSDALVLVTGGAGFIGSHLANQLAESGTRVRVIDALDEQVHGAESGFPKHLHAEVERVEGDIRDRDTLRAALAGVTHVCHLAAAVGVGQSMYEIEHYTDVNNRGTALLLEALIEQPVQRLMVASSMSVYGEGLYRQPDGEHCEPQLRSRDQLSSASWEVRNAAGVLEPVATPETKRVVPASVYALSKYDQEQLCLMFGAAYNIPTVALRFFNAY